MSELLSVRAAAAEAPRQLALLSRRARWTYAEAAAHVEAELAAWPWAASGRAEALSATRTVSAIVRVWAALEAGRPLGLVPPQQPPEVQARAHAALRAHPVPAHAALVLFSSGTTGAPRGVVHGRSGLEAAARAHAARLPWRPADRVLLALPLAAAGGVSALVRALAARRTLVVLDEQEGWPLAEALVEGEVTQASLVPAQLAGLLDDPQWRAPAGLREVLVGGAQCPGRVRSEARRRGVRIRVTYGLSETLGQVATEEADRERGVEADRERDAARDVDTDRETETGAETEDGGRVGPVVPGLTVYAGTAEAVAPIEIEGPTLMIGYLGEAPLAGRLVTSDLGWLDDAGVLHVVGRADEVIVTGGHKVAPLLVEEALRATPGIAEVYVRGIADERWGQLVAALVVPREGFDLGAAAAQWRARLPAHWRPRRIGVVAALPRNPNGKIDRAAAAAVPLVAVPYPARVTAAPPRSR